MTALQLHYRLLALLLIFHLTSFSAMAQESSTGKLMHNVYFYMADDATEADRDQLQEGIASLGDIETVRSFAIGTPASTEARDVIDNTYAFYLMTSFDDMAGHDVYQKHPIHLKFIEDNQHLWTRVQVYDSEME